MIKIKVLELLDVGIIYHISNNKWVSLTQVVPKKSKITIVKNEKNELILTRVQSSWHMCIYYRKLNNATKRPFFPPSFRTNSQKSSRTPYYYFLMSTQAIIKFL